MASTSYSVTGMTCGHCVGHISDEVKTITGVESVEIDLASGTMVINSAEAIPFDKVKEAVEEAGDYQVEEN